MNDDNILIFLKTQPLYRITLFLIFSGILAALVGMGLFYLITFATSGSFPTRDTHLTFAPLLSIAAQVFSLMVLVTILHQHGENFEDIGWSRLEGPNLVLYEVLIAITTLVILLAFQFAVLGPVARNLGIEHYEPIPKLGNIDLHPGEVLALSLATLSIFISDSVYRGFALTRLASRFNLIGSIIIISLCDALFHWFLFSDLYIIQSFFVSVILCVIFLTIAREQLWGLVVGHALFDAIFLISGP